MKKINIAKFFDDFAIAGRGLLLATKWRDFWVSFLITFVVFNILLNLLASGFSAFKLIFSGNFQVLLEAVTKFEALNVALAILQGILIAMIVIVMKHNRDKNGVRRKEEKGNKDKKTREKSEGRGEGESQGKNRSESGVSSAGIIAGLMVLGSGCPTCGTTLLTPVIGAVISGATGAVKIAGVISTVLNGLAILIAILVFRKLGVEVYAIIKSEKFKEKNHEESS